MKRNKGFTLIELLIVIALMSSVLAIVVVSVTEISKKQKSNALEQIKGQVSVAAEQYFSANEYFFEGMNDKATATISVGQLVDSGYIGTLTDPTTGKKLNNCDSVVIEKVGSRYKIKEFKTDESSVCKNAYTIEVNEANEKVAPEEGNQCTEGENEVGLCCEREDVCCEGEEGCDDIESIDAEIEFYGIKAGKYELINQREDSKWLNSKIFKGFDNKKLYIFLKIKKDENLSTDEDFSKLTIKIGEDTPNRLADSKIQDNPNLEEGYAYYYVEFKDDFKIQQIKCEVINNNNESILKKFVWIGKDTEKPYFSGVIIWPCIASQKIEGNIHDDTSGLAAMYGYKENGEIFGAYEEVYNKIKNKRIFIYLIPTDGYVRVHDVAGNIVEHKIPWGKNDDKEIL